MDEVGNSVEIVLNFGRMFFWGSQTLSLGTLILEHLSHGFGSFLQLRLWNFPNNTPMHQLLLKRA